MVGNASNASAPTLIKVKVSIDDFKDTERDKNEDRVIGAVLLYVCHATANGSKIPSHLAA